MFVTVRSKAWYWLLAIPLSELEISTVVMLCEYLSPSGARRVNASFSYWS